MEVFGTIFAIVVIGYPLIGAFFGIRHYIRRHGVWPSFESGGFFSVWFIAMIWPVTFFSTTLRYPSPCTCREHVLARQQERRQEEAYQEALREEQG